MLLKVSGKYIVYDFENNRIVSTLKLKDKAANEDYCVANGNVAYTVNNNLYVNEQAITDEPEGIVCGQSVHRNEFGINKGDVYKRQEQHQRGMGKRSPHQLYIRRKNGNNQLL